MYPYETRKLIVERFLAGAKPIAISYKYNLDPLEVRRVIYSYKKNGKITKYCLPCEPDYELVIRELRQGRKCEIIAKKYNYNPRQIYYAAGREKIKFETYYGTLEKDGKLYDVTNMKQFAKEHDISIDSLRLLLNCEVAARKGWTNPDYASEVNQNIRTLRCQNTEQISK